MIKSKTNQIDLGKLSKLKSLETCETVQIGGGGRQKSPKFQLG